MSAVTLEILFIGVLLLFNSLLAMSEMAIVSVRQARLTQRAEAGSAGARAALALLAEPTRFLSTVQIGITLVGVLAGAFGGATIARVLAASLTDLPYVGRYSQSLGLLIVVVAITYLSLVVGELVPKRIAMQYPEPVAVLIAPPMRRLAWITAPVVALLSASTAALLRLLRVDSPQAVPVTREEIRLLLDEGRRAGVFQTTEQDLVESVLRLDDRHIRALMTPHTEVTWLDVNDPPDDLRRTIAESRHSVFPVCTGSLDRLLGIVHTKNLLAKCLAGEPLSITDQLTPPRFIPENVPPSRAIDLLKQQDVDLLMVIDEHGSIQGVLTEHDLLEALVGEIPSEGKSDDPRAMPRPDGSWLIDGLLHIDEVRELLHLPELPEEGQGVYDTLGGFVMRRTGDIPLEGHQFDWGGWTFEVIDMDGRRVDKIAARPAAAVPSASESSEDR